MPKKVRVYKVLKVLDSESQKQLIYPGETIELAEEDAKILLQVNAITEVTDDPNAKLHELGELQDRAE